MSEEPIEVLLYIEKGPLVTSGEPAGEKVKFG